MQIAIKLCLKDLQHRWPYIAVLESIIALRVLVDILLPLYPPSLGVYSLLLVSFWVVFCLVTVLAVQSDPLIGSRQFWITRPITWRNILAGKILFFICTINLPILIAQSAAMIAKAFSPLHNLSVLGQTQLTIITTVLLFTALASVTRKLVHFAMILLALFVIDNIYARLIISGNLNILDWGSAENIRSWIISVPLIPIALLLLCLQYSRRTTKCTIALIFTLYLLYNSLLYSVSLWHPLAQLRAKTEGVWRSQSPVSLALNHDPSPFQTKGWQYGPEKVAALVLPVRLTGTPEGRELINERMNFKVIAQDGSTWETGWPGFGGIYANSMEPPSRFITADGDYSIATNMDWSFYNRVQNDLVHVRASFAFRLCSRIQIPLPENRLLPVNNQTGYCGVLSDISGMPGKQTLCIFSKEPSGILEYRSGDISSFMTLYKINSGSIWRYINNSQPGQCTLFLHHEEVWFETTLEIPQIRLRDYFRKRFN